MGRTHWGLAAVLVATAVGAGLFFGLWRPRSPEPGPSSGINVVSLAPVETEPGAREVIVVHVSGRVARPGLVRVDGSARVGDVIMAAGGALPGARLGEINLAAPVTDGGQVVVPGPGTGARIGGWSGEGGQDRPRVSINRATSMELEGVPGLGPVLAARIVDYREASGPFREVEDLLDVAGIGEKKLAALREYIVAP